MTIRRNLTLQPSLLLVLIVAATLAGCSSTPRFNDNFGTAVRSNLSAQVINPAAAANANPAVGVDGTAARAAQERYQRSFKDSDTGAERSLINVSVAK
jgi:type IV pilus biogenesis protein CpaD/CtpE